MSPSMGREIGFIIGEHTTYADIHQCVCISYLMCAGLLLCDVCSLVEQFGWTSLETVGNQS